MARLTPQIIVLSWILQLGATVSEAQEVDVDYLTSIEPHRYVAARTTGHLQIDGALDEPSWQRAVWTEAFVDIEGERRPEPRFRTRAKMLWDDDFFYVAAELEEPHVWATLTERDAVIFHDNDFEVFIDPNGDTHNYYELEVNALGTEWDLLLVKPYRDGAPPVHAWDIPGLRSGVKIWGTLNEPADRDEGWSVEIAFPWEGLRRPAGTAVPPKDGHVWRVNFSRVQWQLNPAEDGEGYTKVPGTPEDNWVWSPQGLINMHFPEQWGYVQFSEAPAGLALASFELPPEEEGKRLLREIYYRQRNSVGGGTGRDIADFYSLGVAHRILRQYLWPPTLRTTDHGYEAWIEEVTDLDGDGVISRLLITDDSRVFKVR
ncbi:MAG: carbohydrate-binding family 9-like protein [Candidatus Latescibacterota bacterium]|nr:carbohydrate-binding family 9-like protein [Candidatus Latescibacterota bacterium]